MQINIIDYRSNGFFNFKLAGLVPMLALSFISLAPAQIIVIDRGTWNRSVEEIDIKPGPGSASGKFAVEAKLKFSADNLVKPLDLSAVAHFYINDLLRVEKTLDVKAGPGSETFGCGTKCAELGKPCVCYVDLHFCDCGELYLSVPEFFELQPGDEITIILYPAPGAADESNERDNRRSLTLKSLPEWNRKMEELSITPAPGGSSNDFNIHASFSFAAEGFKNGILPLDFSTVAFFLLNGTPRANFPFNIDVEPVANCEAECQIIGKNCVCVENIGCGCGELKIVLETIQGVELVPGDEITIILRPAPGSIPDHNNADNQMSLIFQPAPGDSFFKRGDVTINGEVDITDSIHLLETLFLGKGVIFCGDAADANDDGNIDVTDPIVILDKLFVGQLEVPFPGIHRCGPDLTADELPCEIYRGCPVLE